MSNYSVVQWQAGAQGSGSALTAAAAAEMIPAIARFPWSPAPPIVIGTKLRFEASGIISCVVTTPGTARFDLRAGSTVVFDTGAMNLNIVAKTSVPWELVIRCRVSAIGNSTSATLTGWSRFTSEGVVGATAGAAFSAMASPGAGGGFDSTITNVMTAFFTQTVATGSITCQEANWWLDN